MAKHLGIKFSDLLPVSPDTGILYISCKYNICCHLCPCGCGQKIVITFNSLTEHNGLNKWTMVMNSLGEISLHPSIGNIRTGCLSHYWIKRNAVIWGQPFVRISHGA